MIAIFFRKNTQRFFPIQIDDQDDDDDNIAEFCNIFVTVKKNGRFDVELFGNIPVTQDEADFAEIYNGAADKTSGKITLDLSARQVEALIDLAKKIRATASMGERVGNPTGTGFRPVTISSLYRFVRIVKEYGRSTSARL